MDILWTAITKVGDTPIAVSRFHIPGVREKGFHQATVSVTCFRSRELDRRWPNAESRPAPARLTWTAVYHPMDTPKDIPTTVPTTVYASLWEFYLGIGYDYKSQRYV